VWHIDAMAEHLEKYIARGMLSRTIVCGGINVLGCGGGGAKE
jgi:hypothetical protein